MATLTFELTTVPGDLSPAPSNPIETDATITSVNANQAQGAPAPLDTVTLTAQTTQGQAAGQNEQEGQFQSSPALAAAAALFANAISAASQNGKYASGKQPSVSLSLAQADSSSGQSTNGPSTVSNVPGATLPASANTGRADLTETQKQQLQRLDETLRQIGIDPQNVSIFKQLALLFYASNPGGLEEFVHQFQATAQQSLQQGSAVVLPTPSDVSQATDSSASGNASAASAQPESATAAQSAANQSSVGSQQFQELQFAMAAVGGQVQLPRPSSSPASEGKPPDATLDITL